MQATEPDVPGLAVTFAKDQPEYNPLPAVVVQRDEGIAVVTRWQLTDAERNAIASGADFYLEILTFGQALQPLRLHVGEPPDADA